jgi:hypothetical protein
LRYGLLGSFEEPAQNPFTQELQMRDFGVARRSRLSSDLSAVLAVASLIVGGCSKREPLRVESGGESASPLNSNPVITNFAVYAQNSVSLQDRATVSGGDVGVHVAGTGPFLVTDYELALTFQAQVDVTHNVIANRVLLQGAKVGDVQGKITPLNSSTWAKNYAFPATMPSLPTLAPVSAGTTALTVNDGDTIPISPGAFGAVTLGTKSVLRLNPGVYHLASVQLDDDARIEALGPVQVRIAGRVSGRLSTLARVWIGAASGVTLTAADLRIEISGKNAKRGARRMTLKIVSEIVAVG